MPNNEFKLNFYGKSNTQIFIFRKNYFYILLIIRQLTYHDVYCFKFPRFHGLKIRRYKQNCKDSWVDIFLPFPIKCNCRNRINFELWWLHVNDECESTLKETQYVASNLNNELMLAIWIMSWCPESSCWYNMSRRPFYEE